MVKTLSVLELLVVGRNSKSIQNSVYKFIEDTITLVSNPVAITGGSAPKIGSPWNKIERSYFQVPATRKKFADVFR